MSKGSIAVLVACAMAAWAVAQATAPSTRPASPAATRPAVTLAAGPATRPATRPAFPDPEPLLHELSSSDWHERRKAQDLLVRLGEEATAYIEDLIRRAPDEEARRNAQAALARIAENRILGPSYITLHVSNTPPAQVFAEISRQCHAAIQTMPDNLWEQHGFQNLTLDVDHQAFWEVMPKICQQLGVDFRPFQYGMRLMRSGMQMQGVAAVEGPFMVIANQITYNRTRMLGPNGAEHTQFGINFSVFPEPKIVVLRGSGSVQLDEAVDDHGNSLLPPGGGRMGAWGGFAGYGQWNLYAPLKYPQKNPGSRIVRLRGHTSFIVQTKVQELTIPDIMSVKNTTRTIHGMEVTFEDVRRQDANYELRLSVAHPNFGSPEWPQLMEQVQSRLRLEDASGHPLDHRGFVTNANNNAIQLQLTFARMPRPDGHPTGEPSRLVWDIPTESKEVSVPIRFDDLPLFDER
ncbi:MAG TPA: HEAT repeat domain-containing protein [Tepidisphaeraceae bacterium]|nr:HEAT repeat domain-containing protein [Tepidisphaeraceae bacterium]